MLGPLHWKIQGFILFLLKAGIAGSADDSSQKVETESNHDLDMCDLLEIAHRFDQGADERVTQPIVHPVFVETINDDIVALLRVIQDLVKRLDDLCLLSAFNL